MAMPDLSKYYIDFSNHDDLTSDEKNYLEYVQKTFYPIERVTHLLDFRAMGKITTDEYETMTGLPYQFDPWGLSGIE